MELPFFALPMDFEWVDIGKVPDYWSAIRNVLQGKVRQVDIPGKEIKPGIFTGLNVAANWEKIEIAAEQAKDFFNIANGIHLMAVKTEHLIPEILKKANLNLEY